MEFLKKGFKHQSPIQIRFNDIDGLGHVNNSVYQQYFDIARVHYFKTVFRELPNWKEKSLVLAEVNIKYFNPVLLDDEISILTRVTHLGNKSLKMTQLVVKTRTQEICSENKAVLVAYNGISNETISLQQKWKEDIFLFEEEVLIKN